MRCPHDTRAPRHGAPHGTARPRGRGGRIGIPTAPAWQALHRSRVDAVIARFNQFNYVGALLGAVLTGAIGQGNLRVGYAVPMVLVLGLIPLARHFAGEAGAAPA